MTLGRHVDSSPQRKTYRPRETPIPLGPNLPTAACKGKSPTFDWQIDGEPFGQRSRRLARAMAICHACPVTARCLKARESNHGSGHAGVWGGELFSSKARVAVRYIDCHCGTSVVTAQPGQEYCSARCKKTAEQQRARTREATAA
jgi:transcription factor WhiB